MRHPRITGHIGEPNAGINRAARMRSDGRSDKPRAKFVTFLKPAGKAGVNPSTSPGSSGFLSMRDEDVATLAQPELSSWMNALVDYVRSGEPDLTNRQMALLLVVYLRPGPHTVRGLARILNVSKPVVTRALNRLGAIPKRETAGGPPCGAPGSGAT